MYEFSAPFQRPDWRLTAEMLMMALLLPGVVLRGWGGVVDGINGVCVCVRWYVFMSALVHVHLAHRGDMPYAVARI